MEEKMGISQNDNKTNKRGKIIATISIIIIILIIAAGTCFIVLKDKKDDKKTNKTSANQLYSEYRMSGNGLENFDLRFLQLEEGEDNVIYSPLSIKYALAMLSEGAKGETKEQIDALIGKYEAKKYINSANMSFANALFIKEPNKDLIKESYKNALKEKYNAEVIYDSFQTPDTVNKWISDNTFNLIDNLVDDVSDKEFILANALAIDMEWKQQIQADAEHYDNHYAVSYDHEKYGDSISVIDTDSHGYINFKDQENTKASEIGASLNNYDIISDLGEDNIRAEITKEYEEWVAKDECGMGNDYEATDSFVNKFIEELNSNFKQVAVSTDFKFLVNDNLKAFSKELKEYDGVTLEYIAIMPTDKSLDEYIKGVSAKEINTVIDNLKTVELGNVAQGKITTIVGAIPLFKYDYELDLAKDLKNLGVTNIFDEEKIDISNIVEDKKVSFDATHKATIEFSNDGIKASAATIMGGLGAIDCGFEHLYDVPIEEIDLTFDNPYLYIIRDKDSGEVWFVGKVYKPMKSTGSYPYEIDYKFRGSRYKGYN